MRVNFVQIDCSADEARQLVAMFDKLVGQLVTSHRGWQANVTFNSARRQLRASTRTDGRQSDQEESEQGLRTGNGKTTLAELALSGLRQRPMKAAELCQWMRNNGAPQYRVERVSALLTYLKQRGKVSLGPGKFWSAIE